LAKVEKGKVFRAAGFLMVTMVISRILGYARDVVLYNIFGQNRITDAYNAAFSIPDFLYSILVGGALSSAFIPVFSSYIAREEKDEAWQVASIVLNWVMLLLSFGIIICFVFTPQLIDLLVPGFDAEAKKLVITLTRIMLFQTVFMSLSGITQGILHSYQHFTAPAVGSMIYNLFIVGLGALLAGPIEARFPGYGVASFSIGVVTGSLASFAVQLRALRKIGIHYSWSFNFRHPGVQRLISLMIPILIGLSVSQINGFVTQGLGSSLSDGMIAALRTGQRFMQLPIGIFAIAIGIAIFPTLTSTAALNQIDEFKKSMSLGVRSVMYITMPSAVGLAVLSEPIIRVMFEFGGEFTAEATTAAAQALVFYCFGLVGYSVTHVLSRSFYALQDTRTPVIIGIVSIVANVLFSLLLVGPLQHRGLALAYSLAGIIQCGLLLLFLWRKLQHIDLRNMIISFFKTAIACVAMGAIAYGSAMVLGNALDLSSKLNQVIQLGTAMVLAVIVFFVITGAMKMEEAGLVWDIFGKRFRRIGFLRRYFEKQKQAAAAAEAASTATEPVENEER